MPKDYQIASIEFFIKNAVAGLFLAPGLGKTAVVLHAFKILKDKGFVNTMLVVATEKIINQPWPKEVKKWGLDFSLGILHGSKKDKTLLEKHDIYLCTYSGLVWLMKKHKKYRKFDILCIDESSKMKHPSASRYKALKAKLEEFKRRYILTGSPAANGLIDLFGQIYLLDLGKALGRYVTQFRTDYFMPVGYKGFGYALMDGAEEKIHNKIKPLVIQYGHDMLDLPPLVFNPIVFKLNDKAQKQYDEMEQEFIIELESGSDIIAATSASASSKLRQIVGGNVYQGTGKNRKSIHLHDDKIDVLKDLIDELQGSPLLVGYEFRHEEQLLRKHFKTASFMVSGMSAKASSQMEDDWNAGKINLLFGQIGVISHGLNLQEGPCCDVAFYTLTWKLDDYLQFIMRVWRQGQKNSVTVHLPLAENTVDETVVGVLNDKEAVQQDLLNALNSKYLLGGTMELTDIEYITNAIKNNKIKPPVYKETVDTIKDCLAFVDALVASFGKLNCAKVEDILESSGEKISKRGDKTFAMDLLQEVIYHDFGIKDERGGTMVSEFKLVRKLAESLNSLKEDTTMTKKTSKKAASKKTAKKTAAKKTAKKTAAKKTATKPAIKKAVKSKDEAAYVVSDVLAKKGLIKDVQDFVQKSKKPLTVAEIVSKVKLDHKKAGDPQFVRYYVLSAIRQEFLVVA